MTVLKGTWSLRERLEEGAGGTCARPQTRLRRGAVVVGGAAASITGLRSSRRSAGGLLDKDVFRGKELADSRPLQALVAGLKAYSTWENVSCLQDCPECTGGMVSPAGPPCCSVRATPALCASERSTGFGAGQTPRARVTRGASRVSAPYPAARTGADGNCKTLAGWPGPWRPAVYISLNLRWPLWTVWERANEGRLMKAPLQCLKSPLRRIQEMTPGLSSAGKKADGDVPSLWRLLSVSPALGLSLDCAVRGTRC